MTAALWVPKKVGVEKGKKERKKNNGGKEELKVILPISEVISTDRQAKDEEKLEGKEREKLRN